MADFPRSVDEIAADYGTRRAGMLRALTDGKRWAPGHVAWLPSFICTQQCRHPHHPVSACAEVEEFYHACDPEKENLCLYGEQSWLHEPLAACGPPAPHQHSLERVALTVY